MGTAYDDFLQALMPRPRVYNLFVSHSWDYGDDRTNLGKLIMNGLGSQYVYDSSAPEDDPIHAASDDELIQVLIGRISNSNVLVFPAGVYASHSKWIPIELAIAKVYKKPIIAVEKWGFQRSTSMVADATEIVGWNSKSVADAIKRWHPVQYASV